MEGWIKIHRAILKHWVFEDSEKFRAWIIILLTVNYELKKVNIGNLLLECNRGESLLSLDSWAKLFGKNWNKSKVRRFFNLLENDSMIVLKNEHKTTRITVCKYDDYQDMRNASETQVKRKRNASETQVTPTKESKESKEVKKEKNIDIPTFEVFKIYALEQANDIDQTALSNKYKSWVENGWKDGNNNKILNWKSKLLNTISYLPKVKVDTYIPPYKKIIL